MQPNKESILTLRSAFLGVSRARTLIAFALGLLSLLPLAAKAQIINTVAGNGSSTYSGDFGPATAAALQLPFSAAVDASGNIYIADNYNHRIRKVATNGVITTVAGNGTAGFNGDGIAATSAYLNYPQGVAVDTSGNLYIADFANGRIRKVSGGIITTIAGTGVTGYSGDVGLAANAKLHSPSGIAVDAGGNIYIADTGNHRVRKVGTNGIITTLAGNGVPQFFGDNGAATSSSLNLPYGVAVDPSGSVYIADNYNDRIRKVSTDGIITTVAGNGLVGYSGDGLAATQARLYSPNGLAVDVFGNIYIADSGNQRVRRVAPNGVISTIAGNGTGGFGGDGGPGSTALLKGPSSVAIDGSGNLYIADTANNRIRKVLLAKVRNDFNTDGKSDLLLQHADGSAALWLMNGPGMLNGAGLIGAGSGWSMSNVGDFNGDGKADILWQHTNGATALWLMNGTSRLSGAGLISAGSGWNPKLVGDFNGDGKSDILWQHTNGASALWLMNGTSQLSGAGLLGAGSGWNPKFAGDFNGDGKADILWQHIDGSTALWLMNGTGLLSGAGLFGAGSGWSPNFVADFNGDGKADILAQHADGSTALWLMNGPSILSRSILMGAGFGWSVKLVADFNADGKADIIWRHADGSVAAWLMNGTRIISDGVLIAGGTGWTPKLAADFNGDGKADVLWQNTAGAIAMWLMSGTAPLSGGGLIAEGSGWNPLP